MKRQVIIRQVNNGYLLILNNGILKSFEEKVEVYESYKGVLERLNGFFSYRYKEITRGSINEESE